MYSIIEINNKQYKAEPGEVLLVDRLDAKKGDEITIDRVLLYRGKDDIRVGTPFLKDTVLKAKVIDEVKGKKVRVFKYKKRKDYRKTKGSRPLYTKIMIEKM